MDYLGSRSVVTACLQKSCIGRLAEGLPGESQVCAADVCLYGLNIIMPLMTFDLLKFPSLCTQFYKLLTYVADIYPEKVSLVINIYLFFLLPYYIAIGFCYLVTSGNQVAFQT